MKINKVRVLFMCVFLKLFPLFSSSADPIHLERERGRAEPIDMSKHVGRVYINGNYTLYYCKYNINIIIYTYTC